MRLPLSKIYRAFAELDRFSDEQCERFVSAAKGRWLPRLVRLLLQGIAGVLGFALVAAALVGVLRALELDPGRSRLHRISDGLLALGIAAGIGAGVLAWLLTRDWLIRRRIGRVIHTRGSCWTCGYGLTGLPVGADLRVVCPECGHRLALEATSGEIVVGEGGLQRFMPSPDNLPPLFRWLTPRRRRWLVRLTIAVPVATVVLGLMGWGGYEWFLRRQAATALASRAGVQGLIALVEKYQPAGVPPDAPDAWLAFYEVDRLISTTDDAAWRAATSGRGPDAIYPDFAEIYSPGEPAGDEEDLARRRAAADLALRLVGQYRAAGVYSMLEEMSRRRRAVKGISAPGPGQPIINILLPELGKARNIARINGARMKLAVDAGDRAEFISAMESNLAMSRMLRHGICLIERLVGAAIQALTFERVRETLARRPDRAWLDAIAAAIQRQHDGTGFDAAVEGERLITLDTIAWVFSDPARVRAGRYSRPARTWAGNLADDDYPLGTFEQNRRAVEEFYADVLRQARLEPWERATSAGAPYPELMLLATLLPALDRSLGVAADEQVCERALQMLLALERFRCDRGSYPESLAELAPPYLEKVPLDPWSGRPFVYRRLGPAADGGPKFLLYSVGPDRTDNGGTETAGWQQTGQDRVVSPKWRGDEAR